MTLWEYCTENADDFGPNADRLNELGRLGWELVSVVKLGGDDEVAWCKCVFKRPKA